MHIAIKPTPSCLLESGRNGLLTEKCTHNTHAMLAIGASMDKVLESDLSGCRNEIACKNGPHDVVLSGTNENINKLHQALSTTGFRLARLGVPFAFHSSQVRPILVDFEQAAKSITFSAPQIPVINHLPKRYYEYCDIVGLLGELNGIKRASPPWLIGHFEACVRSLHDHHASAMDPYVAPQTTIIWACDAIDKHVTPRFKRRPDDPEGLESLTEARTDFGTCEWKTLLPEDSFEIFCAERANHFSMMKGEHAEKLSEFIEIALIG